jgi:DNA polymerase alpha subunit B
MSPCSLFFFLFDDNSYPQPPLQDDNASRSAKIMGLDILKKTSKVHCLSNPCTFQINEVVFGATSTDVLFHTSAEEIHHNLPPNTRLRRIAQHVLQQRSYYPIFPPPAHSPTNLDLKHMDKWKLPCRPDVLLLPSKLKAMACGVLDTTVVINPGPLTRATSGGTYAVLEIHPMKRETLDAAGDDVSIPHNVNERIQVTVKRI